MNNILELDRISINSNICSICLETLNNDNDINKLSCSHTYHNECIKLWYEKNKTCPLCRSKIIIPSLDINLPNMIEVKHNYNLCIPSICCLFLLIIFALLIFILIK
jgi:hypothetical protein